MVCDMSVIRRAGELARYEFFPAVDPLACTADLHAVARALYEEPAACDAATRPLLDPLRALDEVFRVLLSARERRGAIDFETVETPLVFDEQRQDRPHPARAAQRRAPADRGVHARGERLCFRFPTRGASTALYRMHEGPTPEKLEALRGFLKSFGLDLERRRLAARAWITPAAR